MKVHSHKLKRSLHLQDLPLLHLSACLSVQDFDLCVCCYEKNGHKHMVTRLGVGLDIPDEITGPKDPKEAQSCAIQRFIQVLVHAAQCRDRSCKSPPCAKMKRIMSHVRGCTQCGVCKQFLSLCLQHAKTCKSSNCSVPLCANLKKHILEKQRQTSIQENRFAARRMRATRATIPTISSSLGSSSSSEEATVLSPAPSTPLTQQPSQQMYGQRGMMMTHPARPVYGGVSGVMQQGPYASMPQQQQPTASSSLNSSSSSSEEAAVLSTAPSTPLRQQPCAPPPKDDCHDTNHSGEER